MSKETQELLDHFLDWADSNTPRPRRSECLHYLMEFRKPFAINLPDLMKKEAELYWMEDLLPLDEPLTLYRGSHKDAACRQFWTDDIKMARSYAGTFDFFSVSTMDLQYRSEMGGNAYMKELAHQCGAGGWFSLAMKGAERIKEARMEMVGMGGIFETRLDRESARSAGLQMFIHRNMKSVYEEAPWEYRRLTSDDEFAFRHPENLDISPVQLWDERGRLVPVDGTETERTTR